MDRSRVAVVIPAYNETATIARVVAEVARYGVPIVADDGSHDDTAAISEAAGAIVVRNQVNGGYDRALNAGFAEAAARGFDYVVTFDADGQHDPDSVAQVVRVLDAGADVVVGIRPQKARIAETLFAALTRARYGIHDPLSGLKGYRMTLYREQGHFDSRGSIGTELMLFALRRGRRVEQMPIPVREREGGTPRFGQSLRGNLKIMRAIFHSIGE
jgi:glycosyltransferase involved in cell wall biosynthesis